MYSTDTSISPRSGDLYSVDPLYTLLHSRKVGLSISSPIWRMTSLPNSQPAESLWPGERTITPLDDSSTVVSCSELFPSHKDESPSFKERYNNVLKWSFVEDEKLLPTELHPYFLKLVDDWRWKRGGDRSEALVNRYVTSAIAKKKYNEAYEALEKCRKKMLLRTGGCLDISLTFNLARALFQRKGKERWLLGISLLHLVDNLSFTSPSWIFLFSMCVEVIKIMLSKERGAGKEGECLLALSDQGTSVDDIRNLQKKRCDPTLLFPLKEVVATAPSPLWETKMACRLLEALRKRSLTKEQRTVWKSLVFEGYSRINPSYSKFIHDTDSKKILYQPMGKLIELLNDKVERMSELSEREERAHEIVDTLFSKDDRGKEELCMALEKPFDLHGELFSCFIPSQLQELKLELIPLYLKRYEKNPKEEELFLQQAIQYSDEFFDMVEMADLEVVEAFLGVKIASVYCHVAKLFRTVMKREGEKLGDGRALEKQYRNDRMKELLTKMISAIPFCREMEESQLNDLCTFVLEVHEAYVKFHLESNFSDGIVRMWSESPVAALTAAKLVSSRIKGLEKLPFLYDGEKERLKTLLRRFIDTNHLEILLLLEDAFSSARLTGHHLYSHFDEEQREVTQKVGSLLSSPSLRLGKKSSA